MWGKGRGGKGSGERERKKKWFSPSSVFVVSRPWLLLLSRRNIAHGGT